MTASGSYDSCAALSIEVPARVIEAVAQRAAEIVLDLLAREQHFPMYLSVPEAANLMRTKPQRVYDLLSSGRLTRFKDGRRVLVSRAEIETYLAAGALSPVAPTLPPAARSATDARDSA